MNIECSYYNVFILLLYILVDGTYCLVKWGAQRLALLIGSQRVHYMGLYQVCIRMYNMHNL